MAWEQHGVCLRPNYGIKAIERKKYIVVAKLWFPCQYAVLRAIVSRYTTKYNLWHGSSTEFVSG